MNKILSGDAFDMPTKEPELSKTINDLIANIDSQAGNEVTKRSQIAGDRLQICLLKQYRNSINKQSFASTNSNRPQQSQQQSTQSQSSSQPQQQSQQPQQLAQEAQQQSRQNQQRADQARQGKRKTHDPAAEAHQCISIDKSVALYGAFKNTCGSRVNFVTCNYRPRTIKGGFNWSADFDCDKQQFGMHNPDSGQSVQAHNHNTEMVYWFACKAPALPVDTEFVRGQGVLGRCY